MLNLYDILVNVVPGTILLLIISILSTNLRNIDFLPLGTRAIVFITLALVAGQGIQWIGSELEGRPTTFENTIRYARGEDIGGNPPIQVTEIEQEFWDLCVKKFDLPADFSDYGRLFQLVISYLETRPTVRASRFQAIYTFHRSIYALSIITIPTTLLFFLANVASPGPLLLNRFIAVMVLSVIGALVFQARKEKFDRIFIQYTIVDFYINVITDEPS